MYTHIDICMCVYMYTLDKNTQLDNWTKIL